MKICMFTGYHYPSSLNEVLYCGAHKAPFNLSRALAKRCCEVHVIPAQRRIGEKEESFLDGVHIHRYKLSKNPLKVMINLKNLFIKLHTKNAFDAISTTIPIITIHLLKKLGKMNIPIFYTNHGASINFANENLPNTFEGKRRRIMTSMLLQREMNFSLKNSEKCVAVANSEIENMQRLGIRRNRIELIYNGVDTLRYNPKHYVEELKEALNLEDKTVVLYVGRLSPEKGLDYLVKVAPSIIKEEKNVVFLLVGAAPSILGDLASPFKNYDVSLERKIRMKKLQTSFVIKKNIPEKDLPKYYNLGDIYVMFSKGYDPLPSSIFEAMSSGLPIVSTNWESRNEVIKHGKNGFLVEEGNIKSLENSLISLLEDRKLREKMGKSSINIVENKLDINITATKYIQLINRTITK